LDIEAEEGLARAKCTENRFELKSRAFHEQLRKAYHEIARGEPERCKIIDAAGSREKVFAQIWRAVEPLAEVLP
jgi:dTMP kinase